MTGMRIVYMDEVGRPVPHPPIRADLLDGLAPLVSGVTVWAYDSPVAETPEGWRPDPKDLC